MNPFELIAHCVRSQELQGRDDAFVTLVLDRPWPRSARVRVFPGGPLFRVLGETRAGKTLVHAPADKIIAAVEKGLRVQS